MSVKLRLRRMGKKKRPFYRIVAIDSRTARDGRYLENLGTYDPITDPATVTVNEERALYWLGHGAIPSHTVKSFLKRKGVLLKWHLMKQGADDAVVAEELSKWQMVQLERGKRSEALAEQKKRGQTTEAAESKQESKEGQAKGPQAQAQPQEIAPETEASAETPESSPDENVEAEKARDQTPDNGDTKAEDEDKKETSE